MSSVEQIEGPIVFVSPNPIDIGPSIDVKEAYTAITTAIKFLEKQIWEGEEVLIGDSGIIHTTTTLLEDLEKLQRYYEYFLEREVELQNELS